MNDPDMGMRESAWQVINRLFETRGLPHPPTRLRDELVSHLMLMREATEALGDAATTFERYAELHLAKRTLEGNEKAAANELAGRRARTVHAKLKAAWR